MEILKNTYKQKPVVLYDLKELQKSLYKINAFGNSQFSTQIINSLIAKVELMIKELEYDPRLPWEDLEQEIIKICRQDPSMHGVVVNILFANKFGVVDKSRLSQLTINV